jgi:GT2 family glycosyltransferase
VSRGGRSAAAYWCSELDLSSQGSVPNPPHASNGPRYTHARLLIRDGPQPKGFITVPLRDGRLAGRDVDAAIEESGFSLAGAPREVSLARPNESRQFISAVVCTRGRPDMLSHCIAALRQISYRDCEVIILDNAPPDDAAQRAFSHLVGDDPRFRYVVEPRRGLARARNHALNVARGEIIAFTDDDVQVDPLWLEGVLRGFRRARGVGAVTGMVASASLLTQAEQYFDARVWWSSSCVPRVYWESRGPDDPMIHPYGAGRFGTGANMAFRRDLMLALGGFDEAFGAGSITGGSEDLDAFVRVLRSGYGLSYEPSALVWHEHRSGDEALRQQMYEYGKALSAYITKYLLQPDTGLAVLRRAPQAAWHLFTLARRSDAAAKAAQVSQGVKLAELRGFFAGPWAYYRARKEVPLPLSRVAPQSEQR